VAVGAGPFGDFDGGDPVTAPTQTIRITHSWCPTCQGGATGKARCSTPKPVGTWPATVAEQVCIVCVELAQSFCERCGE
jgi:hypothetical protein